jgi:DNA anti-recombination protein RmuC
MELSLQEIKNKIEAAEKKVTLAEGAIAEIKKQWKTEFDCESEAEIKEQLKILNSQIEKLQEKYKTALTDLQEKVKEFGDIDD